MIRELHITNFTLFSEAKFTFGALNVIHGENSSGKSHLLKLAYSLTSALTPRPNEPTPPHPTKAWLENAVGTKIGAVFRPQENKLGRLASRIQGSKRATILAKFSGRRRSLDFSFSTRSSRAVAIENVPTRWLSQASVFFPTRELLSVYPGFVSLYETQAIPFDETWRDTCLLLGAPISRGPKKREIAALLEPLEAAIGCKAVLDGDRFFLKMKIGNIEADLVAEGYRKLSMLARLIANGSLDDKGYLFWDEPEANLNPALIKRLAPLLLDLAEGGMQVFIATHSLFLMREIEIELASRLLKVATQYIGLHPTSAGVQVQQGPSLADTGDITALDESLQQSDRYLQMTWATDN
jgi:energy-coupling factor transporter ATP-binding protein EcfA2